MLSLQFQHQPLAGQLLQCTLHWPCTNESLTQSEQPAQLLLQLLVCWLMFARCTLAAVTDRWVTAAIYSTVKRSALTTCLLSVADDARTSTTAEFLRATAGTAIARLSHRNSVCLSVRLSHGWIRQKRCKLGSSNLHHRCPKDSSFRICNAFPKNSIGVTPIEGLK